MMHRYFFECAYDGSAYFGWQFQPKQNSVQETIEKYLTRLNSNHPVEIIGCGRTDAGVHANSSIFHFELDQEINTLEWVYKLNKMLPDSIIIKSGKKVTLDDHARFSAKKRTYRYYIHQEKSPFQGKFSTFFPQELDFDAMNTAAQELLGLHDFTTFSKTNTDVKTHLCTVFEAKWVVINKNEAYFEYSANRFLRNMVRATVGSLFQVGLHKQSTENFRQILHAKDRRLCAGSAPAEGLFLWEVIY